MKNIFTIIMLTIGLSASSQEMLVGENDQTWAHYFFYTTDMGETRDTLIYIHKDSTRFVESDVWFDGLKNDSATSEIPTYIVASFNGKIQAVPVINLIAGTGIDITGTWPNFTISLEEPELMPMAPDTPMKHDLEPFVMKVEYYDMNNNLLPYEPASGHFVVWNYMTDGKIEKYQVEKK